MAGLHFRSYTVCKFALKPGASFPTWKDILFLNTKPKLDELKDVSKRQDLGCLAVPETINLVHSGPRIPWGAIRSSIRPSASMIKPAGVNMRVRRLNATADSAAANANIPSIAGSPIWRNISAISSCLARPTRSRLELFVDLLCFQPEFSF